MVGCRLPESDSIFTSTINDTTSTLRIGDIEVVNMAKDEPFIHLLFVRNLLKLLQTWHGLSS